MSIRLLVLAGALSSTFILACEGCPLDMPAFPALNPASLWSTGHDDPRAHAAPLVRRKEWPLLGTWLRGADVSAEPSYLPAHEEKLVSLGARLFATYCRNCHGDEGRGDGPRSSLFNPRPRDLSRGVFKFRSTGTGELPTRADLFRIISGGLRGTGMLPFADLLEGERWALVTYVRTLSPDFAEEAPGETFAPLEPPFDLSTPTRVARGKEMYARMKCADCHGDDGRGDGPSAPTLKDDFGIPLPPPDFATRPLKRGSDPASAYLTFMTGLDGTPMPSYADAIGDEMGAWDLVAFVRSLHNSPATDPRDRDEAKRFIEEQYADAVHAVVGGCGCNAGKR